MRRKARQPFKAAGLVGYHIIAAVSRVAVDDLSVCSLRDHGRADLIEQRRVDRSALGALNIGLSGTVIIVCP